MNNPVIYPYNSLLEWNDTTSITISGSADTSSVSVSAIENGVLSSVYYNATSKEWLYETSITGYVNNFVIISEDSINNSASSYANIYVNSPIIINSLPSYNLVNPSLEGHTSSITLRLEASSDGINYSPSGFVYDSFTNDFIFNNFRFDSPAQSYYFVGRDIGGGTSNHELITLNYLMHDPLIYTEITDPHDSRTVSLAGSADHDVTGFVYSPVGGQFTSGRVDNASGGFTDWSYKFVMMEQSEEFNIKTIDVFGGESSEQTLTINYGVEKPIILLPGTIKVLTDDTSILGSHQSLFLTTSGDFKNDGVIIGDIVLACDGSNISEYRAVTEVHDTYLITEPFPFIWGFGSKIKIYPKEDRPTMSTDLDKIDISGKCNNNIAKVRYTTEELIPFKVSAKNLEGYLIDTSNNNLVININGKLELIVLPSGLLTAQDIADQINLSFSTTFNYDVAFSDGERLYLQALHIHIFPGTANTIIGFVEGEVNFTLEFKVPDTVTMQNSVVGGADCSEEVVLTGILFCMNIDGVYVRFTLNTNTEYTKTQIIDKINNLAGKEVATSIDGNIVIHAATNIWVGDPLPALNIKEQLNGDANFNNGINLSTNINRDPDSIETGHGGAVGTGGGDWNININIVQPSNNFRVYGLSEFYELSPSVSLNIEYVIPPPTINTTPSTVYVNFVDLSGTYNSSALGVTVNGVKADLDSNGQWVYQATNLVYGDNTLEVVATDRFSRLSASNSVIVNFKDPSDVPYPNQPGGLNWKSVSNPSLAPDDVQNIADIIAAIFNPTINRLNYVSGLLDNAKAYIMVKVLGPKKLYITALRAAIQALIDHTSELLSILVNGAGLYTLSTLPSVEDMKAGLNLGMFEHIKGSFPDFFRKIENSFYDSLDSHRPQVSTEATVGGMILAIGDGAGIADLIKSYKSLSELYNKQKFDYGLDPVNNLKVEGQNQRNVLTWTAPDGGSNVFPYDYVVLRSKVSGGKIKTQKVKTQLSSEDKGNQHYEEDYYDPDTGKSESVYEEIGRITNYHVMKEYKFIDGSPTSQENKNAQGADKYVNGTLDFFTAAREFVLVRTGSTNKPIVNGDTYYYKVVPEVKGTDVRGNSPEVVSAASLPLLEEKTEYLFDQIGETKAGYFQLTGSIYNRDTALFAESVTDIQVKIDGATTAASFIYAEKGIVILPSVPKVNLEIKYWTKKLQKTTRASLVGLMQGPFTFKEETNTLGIQVGRGATITETYGGTPITRTQWVTFTRFKSGESQVVLSAEDVASVIRSQTSGLKVFVDKLNRIVIEEDQNPNIYVGSYLKITGSNKILGFATEADKANYGISSEDNTHTESSAGPLGGVPPDWKSIRISDLFPAVNDLIRYINNTFDQLSKGLASATESLIDFIDLLQKKIDALSDMLKEAKALLKRMENALTIQGGFYCLIIPPNSGGITYFNNAIKTSTGFPSDAEYAGGIVFMYTDGGTGVALDWFIRSLH